MTKKNLLCGKGYENEQTEWEEKPDEVGDSHDVSAGDDDVRG